MAQSKPPFGTPLNAAHWASQGLVGCWLLNEGSGTTAYDSSGKGAAGTITSAGIWTSGPWGAALTITYGSSNNVRIGAAGTDCLSATNGIYTVLVGANSTEDGNNRALYNGKSDFLWISGGYPRFTDNGTTVTGGVSTITPNEWHYAGLTRNASAINFYVDGKLSGTPDLTPGTFAVGTVPLYLGNTNSGTRGIGVGISHVMIWNRVLSAAEIAYLNAFPFAMFDYTINFNVRQIYSIPRVTG